MLIATLQEKNQEVIVLNVSVHKIHLYAKFCAKGDYTNSKASSPVDMLGKVFYTYWRQPWWVQLEGWEASTETLLEINGGGSSFCLFLHARTYSFSELPKKMARF